MLAIQCYRRESVCAMPRVFVDVTTSLMLAGKQPIGISRVEGEVARRLLLFSNLNSIPVVFRNDGVLLALNPEQVALVFSSRPVGNSQENSVGKRDSLLRDATCGAAPTKERRAHGQHWSLPIRLKLMIVTRLRQVVRAFVFSMPPAVREDVGWILIHAKRIARTIVYGPPRAGLYQHAEPVATSTSAHSILPTLRMVVHPRSGDVLWTANPYSDFVPLRTIAEMRVRSGLRVATNCYRAPDPESNPSGAVADAVALLDASDLVLAVSERTRRELLGLATRLGRESPAVQVLQIGSELCQWLDPDQEDSPNATVVEALTRPILEPVFPEPRHWDEVAEAVRERLRITLAGTEVG
jgi:hypothetical protein